MIWQSVVSPGGKSFVSGQGRTGSIMTSSTRTADLTTAVRGDAVAADGAAADDGDTAATGDEVELSQVGEPSERVLLARRCCIAGEPSGDAVAGVGFALDGDRPNLDGQDEALESLSAPGIGLGRGLDSRLA